MSPYSSINIASDFHKDERSIEMAPTIILIRHGEAEHNATLNWDILDPPLTALGQHQCKDLEKHLKTNLPLADKVEVIITSPFTRTVETTLLGLDWLIKRGVKIETDALWQGTCADSKCTFVKWLRIFLGHRADRRTRHVI